MHKSKYTQILFKSHAVLTNLWYPMHLITSQLKNYDINKLECPMHLQSSYNACDRPRNAQIT